MKKAQIRSNPPITVLVITVGFLVVYVISKWEWSLYTSLVVGVAGILSGYLRRKIDFFWMKLTWVLSLIVPNILLTIIYFFILTPLALLSRVFRKKDPMSLLNSSVSMYKNNGKSYSKESFEKPW